MLEKPKIFIRFFPGASGHFLGSILFSLCTPIELNNPLHGHENRKIMNSNNMLGLYFQNLPYDNTDSNLEEEIARIKKYRFEGTPYPFFVIPTHIVNPTSALVAFKNTKLINIKHHKSDTDQLTYNDVIKSPHFFTKTFPSCFENFKRLYPNKLVDLKLEDIKITDTKLMTYIAKNVSIRFSERFRDFPLTNVEHLYNIERGDVVNGSLVNKLDELAEFIGIEITDNRRANAIELIKKYTAAQITCPWKIDINDYD
jgi:hypothetical protein